MSYLRQLSLVDMDKLQKTSITIIGSGSIGSFTTLALAKMGVKNITLYDEDKVELHNISNQFFTLDQLDKEKVIATVENAKLFASEEDIEFIICPWMFSEDDVIESEITIVCPDNIETRALVYEKWLESDNSKFLIDVRTRAELVHVYSVTPKNHVRYLETLDIDNQEEPCTARNIIYTVLYSASIVCNHVKKFIQEQPIPFHLVYSFPEEYLIKE